MIMIPLNVPVESVCAQSILMELQRDLIIFLSTKTNFVLVRKTKFGLTAVITPFVMALFWAEPMPLTFHERIFMDPWCSLHVINLCGIGSPLCDWFGYNAEVIGCYPFLCWEEDTKFDSNTLYPSKKANKFIIKALDCQRPCILHEHLVIRKLQSLHLILTRSVLETWNIIVYY